MYYVAAQPAVYIIQHRLDVVRGLKRSGDERGGIEIAPLSSILNSAISSRAKANGVTAPRVHPLTFFLTLRGCCQTALPGRGPRLERLLQNCLDVIRGLDPTAHESLRL